jgi:DegV family protein with EDD domain
VKHPRIAYVDGKRLRRGILAGVRHVTRQRSELDRINVFPVPDGDTGTNLTLTLSSIADAVRSVRSDSLTEVADAAAEASVLAARGNSGMLFSHFLLGFAVATREKFRAGSREVAEALSHAASSLHEVLENPREGTIVSVARDMAAEARRRAAEGGDDIYDWLRSMHVAAERSLRRTREILPALREAGVVDAGAKGFVSFFEGVLGYIEGRIQDGALEEFEHEPPDAPGPSLYFAREAGMGAGEGRYCTQIAVRTDGEAGDVGAPEDVIRAALAGHGTSTIVLRAGTVVKVHVHADAPDEIAAILEAFGEIVSRRVEDTAMAGTTRHVGVLTDSSADLPRDWVERHGVQVVPVQVILGDRSYRDGTEIDAARLYEIMSDPSVEPPKTSQPAPSDFRNAGERAVERGAEGLLGIFLGASLSGTYGSGAAALRALEGVRSEVVDSRSTTLGLGLMVVRAVELLDEGRSLDEVAAELRRIRERSNVFFTVDTMEYLLRSGRVGRARAWLGEKLDLKPILSLDREGHVVAAGRVRGREAAIPRVLELLDERLVEAHRYRFGVVHFAAAETARLLVAELRRRYDPVEILSGPATAALGVHVGPGAWAIAYQIED